MVAGRHAAGARKAAARWGLSEGPASERGLLESLRRIEVGAMFGNGVAWEGSGSAEAKLGMAVDRRVRGRLCGSSWITEGYGRVA